MSTLNRVQSRVFPSAFKTDDNLLICAPTGAGKTNVAMLTIAREIGKFAVDGAVDQDRMKQNMKLVYIAPMKALVQEVVANFSSRLAPFGLVVRELSGDQQLSRAQIDETQLIVTTPEKWDVVTRRTSRTYTKLVRLVIIDEIHLLHDERGAVLESVVARTLRAKNAARIVGISATLPNYHDIGAFLRCDVDKGVHYFDGSYRPVPLLQKYIGLTEKKAYKRFQLSNKLCYEKISDGSSQTIVFVHSRKETAKTARALVELAIENDELANFCKDDTATMEILREEAAGTKDRDLKELLVKGFGIHHAGMAREDRSLVESLFEEGHIKVLCSTATLAWGVNLPASKVVIRARRCTA